jgi:hypothetical protein
MIVMSAAGGAHAWIGVTAAASRLADSRPPRFIQRLLNRPSLTRQGMKLQRSWPPVSHRLLPMTVHNRLLISLFITLRIQPLIHRHWVTQSYS